jgi:hypothetical protein
MGCVRPRHICVLPVTIHLFRGLYAVLFILFIGCVPYVHTFLERCKSKTKVSTVGVSGEETWAKCGALPGFPGNALIVKTCPVGILSGILAERLYPIVYHQGKSYTVMVDSDLHIKFDKRPNDFYVEKIFVDGEAPLVAAGLILAEYRLQMIQVGAGEHVVIIKRAIRLVKERVRCLLVDLPWPLPKGWVRYLVYYVVSRINSLPRMSGTGLSAREEFRGRKLSYVQDLTLCFGDYCQAYRAPTFKNSMKPRTVGAIALCPIDNLTRSWIFMNLITVSTFTASK